MSSRSCRNLLGVAVWLAVIIACVFGIPGVPGVAGIAGMPEMRVTVTTPGDLNGRGTTVALPDHPLFWAGFIVVGEP